MLRIFYKDKNLDEDRPIAFTIGSCECNTCTCRAGRNGGLLLTVHYRTSFIELKLYLMNS